MVIPGERLVIYVGLTGVELWKLKVSFFHSQKVETHQVFPSIEDVDVQGRGKVFLILSSKYAFSMVLEYPVEVKSRLDRVLELDLVDKVPFDPADVYWGYWIQGEGENLRVVVSFAFKKDVDPIVQFLKNKGWSLGGIVPSHFCISLYARSRGLEQGVFVLDQTSRELDAVVLSREGARPAPLKRDRAALLSGDLPEEDLSNIREKVVLEVLNQVVMRRVQDRLPHIGPGRFRKDIVIPLRFLAYATPILLLFFTYFWAGRQIQMEQMRIKSLKREGEQLQRKIDEKQKTLNSIKRNIALSDRMNRFSSRGIHALEVLSKLTELIPANSYLDYLELRGNRIKMRGKSSSTLDMIKKLESCDLFKNCRLISLTKGIRSNKERFTLEMYVNDVAKNKQ